MRIPLRRLREQNAATAQPQLQRGEKHDPDDRDEGDPDDAANTPARKPPKKAKESATVSFRSLLREAVVSSKGTGTQPRYEVVVVEEGIGNAEDRRVYTREALQQAVGDGMFEGLQAYSDHPTPQEERDQPERSIKKLVGTYENATFAERARAGAAQVRADFVPITGEGYEWVVSLVESALARDPDTPLIGISILGDGIGDEDTYTDGLPATFIREIASLESADLVTRAGAGGKFLRRLSESVRGLDASRPGTHDKEDHTMKLKPQELQERIRAATQTLREAAQADDGDETARVTQIRQMLGELGELAGAEVEQDVEIREVEKPVAASGEEKDQLATKLRETEQKRDTLLRERDEAVSRAEKAEDTLEEAKKLGAAIKLCREGEIPSAKVEKLARRIVRDCETVEQMREAIADHKAERDELLSELRESFVGVEGHGARVPVAAGASRDLAADAGLAADELADPAGDDD